MKRRTIIALGVVLLCGLLLAGIFFAAQASAVEYVLSWWTISSGGGLGIGEEYTLNSTIGQPITGMASGGDYAMTGGFWSSSSSVKPAPTITKRVSPEGQIHYGNALTYTLVISQSPGTELSLYDPLTGTTFVRFVEQPIGIEYASHAITGTMVITPTNQMTVSFVVQVGVPETIGIYVDVSNAACVYPVGETIIICEWSNTVTNQAYRPYTIFLPLVIRNQ